MQSKDSYFVFAIVSPKASFNMRDTSFLCKTPAMYISHPKSRTRKQGSCETIHQVGLGQSNPRDCRQRKNNEQHMAVLERARAYCSSAQIIKGPSWSKEWYIF